MNHKTIKKTCIISGTGIHSGQQITLTISPSTSGKITFYDPKNNTLVVSPNTSAKTHTRATILKNKTMTIATPEHMLSACAALGITSLDIKINGTEIPICDGSALQFFNMLKKSIVSPIESSSLHPIIIQNTHEFQLNNGCIIISPAPTSLFSYYLSYEHPIIGTQTASIDLSKNNYVNEIAPARTFGFEHEIKALLNQGLAKGGSLENALVIGKHNYINTPRFNNECARHKLLDLIGDFWILNRPIIGHVIGIRSGHQLTNNVIKELIKIY